jgi:hypothetical protein
VNNLGPGTYVLKAIAVDYGESSATNSITITVVPPGGGPITLSAPARIGGNFQFLATGVTAGKSVVLQTATSLAGPINWMTVITNVAGSSSISLTNPITTGAHFFRVVQLP